MKDYEVKKIRERIKRNEIVIFEGEEYILLKMAEFEYYTTNYSEKMCYISEEIKLSDFINNPNKNKEEYIELEKYFVEWDVINEDVEEEEYACDWDIPNDVYRTRD